MIKDSRFSKAGLQNNLFYLLYAHKTSGNLKMVRQLIFLLYNFVNPQKAETCYIQKVKFCV